MYVIFVNVLCSQKFIDTLYFLFNVYREITTKSLEFNRKLQPYLACDQRLMLKNFPNKQNHLTSFDCL